MKMDEETYKFYIEAIEELIEDEEKILTYTVLANNLSISVNLAKHLLDFYVKKYKEKKITVTYFVSGISVKNNAVVMTILDQKSISTWNKKVSRILSNHIYSIQKGSSSKINLNEIFFSNTNFDDYCSQKTAIKSSHICQRSEDSLQNIRELTYNSLGAHLTKQSIAVKTKSTFNEQSKEVERNQINNNASAPSNGNVEKKNKVLSMFGNQKVKSENDINLKTNQKLSENKPNQKTKGIQGFFQKHPAHLKGIFENKKEEKDVSNKGNSQIKQNEEIVNNVKGEKQKDINIQEKKLSEKKIEKTAKKDVINDRTPSSNNNKKPSKQNKKNQEAKKRKRVICMSDSDDSDDKLQTDDDPFEENQEKEHFSSEDEVIPPTPVPTVIKAVNYQTNPRKRRKVIDKTFTDDEGYILTKKEVVYESYSEDEEITSKGVENVKSKKSPLKEAVQARNTIEVAETISIDKVKNLKTKKGVPALKNNKQSTLMSFFKKS